MYENRIHVFGAWEIGHLSGVCEMNAFIRNLPEILKTWFRYKLSKVDHYLFTSLASPLQLTSKQISEEL